MAGVKIGQTHFSSLSSALSMLMKSPKSISPAQVHSLSLLAKRCKRSAFTFPTRRFRQVCLLWWNNVHSWVYSPTNGWCMLLYGWHILVDADGNKNYNEVKVSSQRDHVSELLPVHPGFEQHQSSLFNSEGLGDFTKGFTARTWYYKMNVLSINSVG